MIPPSLLSIPSDNLILLSDVNAGEFQSLPIAVEKKRPTKVGGESFNHLKDIWLLSGGREDLHLDGMPPWTPLCCGSLVKYAAVATNRADLLVQIMPTKSAHVWDHAAGITAVVASGGYVTDENLKPVLFTDTQIIISKASTAIVATGPHADHEYFCALVRRGLQTF